MDPINDSFTDPKVIAEEVITLFRMLYDMTERPMSVAGEKINYRKRIDELERRLSGKVNLAWWR